MDTTNILFICGGTFVGIEKIIGKRVGRKRSALEVSARPSSRYLGAAAQVDLRRHVGIRPDSRTRRAVAGHMSLKPLDNHALVRVLTEPKNALVKQYSRFFDMEGSDIEFTNDALLEIAKMAKAKDTGAHGLRSIVEDIMLDIMFELPDRAAKDKGKFVVTAEVVRKEKSLFDTPPIPLTPAKSASERKKESSLNLADASRFQVDSSLATSQAQSARASMRVVISASISAGSSTGSRNFFAISTRYRAR